MLIQARTKPNSERRCHEFGGIEHTLTRSSMPRLQTQISLLDLEDLHSRVEGAGRVPRRPGGKRNEDGQQVYELMYILICLPNQYRD